MKSLLIALIAMPLVSSGQTISFSAGINYGHYSLKDLKHFQENISENPTFYYQFIPAGTLKNTVQFPDQIGYEATATCQFGKWSLGITGWRVSTGARSTYEDYSGSVNIDMVTTVNGIGLKGMYELFQKDKTRVYGMAQSGIGWNEHTVTYKSEIYNPPSALSPEPQKFHSQNWFLAPGVGARYFLTNQVFFSGEIKYQFNIKPGTLSSKGVYLEDLGSKPSVQWDGLLFGLNIGYIFNKHD